MNLTARMEPFDSFWEAPEDIEKGFFTFSKFYEANYLKYIPENKGSSILALSCGPGYFVNLLNEKGYTNVLGIDSDTEKIKYAERRGLNCQVENGFDFLDTSQKQFDVIIAEQEINHLTIEEMFSFLKLCKQNLKKDGILIVHSLNGANPITGTESLAQNIDHYNTLTEYSLKQVLEYSDFKEIKIIPLNLYVFYSNPFNYVAILLERLNTLIFRFNFKLYGKSNKIFTKKIAGICKK